LVIVSELWGSVSLTQSFLFGFFGRSQRNMGSYDKLCFK
jgi:hypothetical protein